MPGFKSFAGAVCAAALAATPALAADGALLAGKPAGVKQAQISDGTLLVGGIGVAVVAAVAIVVSNQNTDRSQPLKGPVATITSVDSSKGVPPRPSRSRTACTRGASTSSR